MKMLTELLKGCGGENIFTAVADRLVLECPCCTLWRGMFIGAVIGAVIGGVVGAVFL